MCFNKESSFLAFIFGFICSTYLMIRNYPNDRYFGLFSYSICIMQIAEFFIWLDQKCTWINKFFSSLLPIILFIQSFLLIFGAYYYGDLSINNNLLLPLVIYYAILLFGIVLYNFYKFKSNNILCTVPSYNKNKYLYWNNKNFYNINYKIIYYIPYTTIFLIKNIKSLIIYSLYLVSINILFIFFNIKSWKSLWCFYGNLFPLIVIIVGHYIYTESN